MVQTRVDHFGHLFYLRNTSCPKAEEIACKLRCPLLIETPLLKARHLDDPQSFFKESAIAHEKILGQSITLHLPYQWNKIGTSVNHKRPCKCVILRVRVRFQCHLSLCVCALFRYMLSQCTYLGYCRRWHSVFKRCKTGAISMFSRHRWTTGIKIHRMLKPTTWPGNERYNDSRITVGERFIVPYQIQ